MEIQNGCFAVIAGTGWVTLVNKQRQKIMLLFSTAPIEENLPIVFLIVAKSNLLDLNIRNIFPCHPQRCLRFMCYNKQKAASENINVRRTKITTFNFCFCFQLNVLIFTYLLQYWKEHADQIMKMQYSINFALTSQIFLKNNRPETEVSVYAIIKTL